MLRGLLNYVPPAERKPLLASLLACVLPRWLGLGLGFPFLTLTLS